MARKNRTPEENARREKIRELLQMANIDSILVHKVYAMNAVHPNNSSGSLIK